MTGQTVVADGGLSLGNAMLSPPKRYALPRPVLAPIDSSRLPASEEIDQPVTEQNAGALELSQSTAASVNAGLAIAVVGMGMIVPGADSPEEFFRTLCQNTPVFTEPGNRWDLAGFYAPRSAAQPDSTYVRTSGYIHGATAGVSENGSVDFTESWLAHALRQSLAAVTRTETDRHMLVVGYTADGSQHLEESLVRAGIQSRLASEDGDGIPEAKQALGGFSDTLGTRRCDICHMWSARRRLEASCRMTPNCSWSTPPAVRHFTLSISACALCGPGPSTSPCVVAVFRLGPARFHTVLESAWSVKV